MIRSKIKRIEKVTPFQQEFVYDIGVVGENKTFIANNILVHNSCYFSYQDPVNKNPSIKEVVDYANNIAELVNASYKPFTQNSFLTNEFHSKFLKCAREVVASGGIFVTKKRYILHVMDKEGKAVDEAKVMGLDLKKSNLPVYVQEKLTEIVLNIIKGQEWDVVVSDIMLFKDKVRTNSIMNIGIPKGVKRVEHYTEEFETLGMKARLPGHVAASIFYNIMRKHENAFDFPAIASGSKIRVFKLKNKIGKFKSIALPRDIEDIPPWFEKHVDINIEEHVKSLIDKPLNNILHAIGKSTPTNHTVFIDSFLEF